MSLDLPPELRSVAHYVVGVWPSADEDGLRRLAGVYEGAAREALGLAEALAWQSSHVPGWEGEAREAHDEMVDRVLRSSGLADFVDAAERIAGGARETAAQVEKAKYQALIIAAWLAASIAWALSMAVWTGGASLGWLAAAEALANELLGQVGQWLVRAVAAAGTGAAFMMASDGLSQGIVIAKGHSDHFDVKSFLTSAGIGAVAGLVGLGVMTGLAKGEVAARVALSGGEAGEKLVLPVWTMSLPGQIVQQAGISAGMNAGFRAVQGTPVTDTGASLAQGAIGAFGGRYGAHTKAGGAPKGLAEALQRLAAARDGFDFEPFEAVPDSGQGFDLPGGQRLEITTGGTWWARPQDAGTQSTQTAFASAVRTMGPGQNGRPRLVVGTPDTSPGDAGARLEAVWNALQQDTPRGHADLPREIVLATPVGTGELTKLQEFVATHGVTISVRARQTSAETVSIRPSAESGAVPSRAGQWLFIAPFTEAAHRTPAVSAKQAKALAVSSARSSTVDPLLEPATKQQTVASGQLLGHDHSAGTARGGEGRKPVGVSQAPQATGTSTHSVPSAVTGPPDVTAALAPVHESPGQQRVTERTWEEEKQQWRKILQEDGASAVTPVPKTGREGFPASREEAWTNYRSALAEQQKVQHVLEIESQRSKSRTSTSQFSPEQAMSDARRALNQAYQQTRSAEEDLRAWGSEPKERAAKTTPSSGTTPTGRPATKPTGGKKPSPEQVDRALGKLPQARYEHLSARTDRFVRTDPIIGNDTAAHQSRTAQKALRNQVIHKLHHSGETAARKLADELGITRTRGLPGGWDAHWGESREYYDFVAEMERESSSPEPDSDSRREESFSEPETRSDEPDSEPESVHHDSEEWITIHKFASEYGIPPSTMRSWVERSGLTALRDNSRGTANAWGTAAEYRRSDLNNLLNEHASSYRPRY